ncbi:MAG: hypothetical protein AAFQ84_05700 [Pseudomonadota bacterium]
MLQWLLDNGDLLIAVFGAGGAGTVILAAFIARRKSNGRARGEMRAEATSGGVAAVHGGNGDVTITVNELIAQHDLDALSHQLGLQPAPVATLLRIARDAGLNRDALQEAAISIAKDANAKTELADALVAGREGAVADLLLRQGRGGAEQPFRPTQ